MAGRRRRASTSSVETVDTSQIRWRQESSVVRSVEKGLPFDNWPVFELQDAIVLNKDGETIENALHVGHQGPFIVRGNLIIDDAAQRTRLIMRLRGATPLEIRRCTSYSIGESPDGRPLIWVSGQGGWYEIGPCSAYKPMYNKMCEATTMYYTIVDVYAEDPPKKTKKAKNNSIQDELAQVFHKYAARIGDGATLEEVFERTNEHSAFFIDQFSHDDGLMDNWKSTAFYKYVTSEHAELGIRIKEAMEKLRVQSYAPDAKHSSREKARSRSMKSSSVEVIDRNAFSASQRLNPVSAASRPAARPAPEVTPTPGPVMPLYAPGKQDEAADSPLQSVRAALEDIYCTMASSKKGMIYATTLSKLYFNYSFPTYKDSRVGSYKQPVEDALHYYSKALIETLDPKYHNHEVYAKLQELAKIPFRPVAYKSFSFPVTLVPRKSQPRKGTSSQTPSTPVAAVEDRRHHPQFSTTETPRPQGKCPARTPGKSALRPVNRAPKRLRDEFESDDEPPGVKRSHYFGEDDFMDDVPGLDSLDENDADDDAGADAKDAKSSFGIEPIKLVIRADRVPDSSPRGPHETWTCDEEGCDYIVRGGDEEDCQQKIRQHFKDHEREFARVNLAIRESARGHMPINHLLEKIKQMKGEQGERLQPIKRKLIV
ncbi:hypothetical protein NOR_05886 [Metarhizium rileyi]|uniref:DNA (cytosine-5)-methyltransferase 1 replication foci domain-containing protein n=1 Tax=Metarhizium rileyi (strain RCEF 4871) TaxID=1649241 RepID=A0A167BR79_METRR|nr:hypothetical protein NOR_05886 [Metarhizium rileyi RCEF 4871]